MTERTKHQILLLSIGLTLVPIPFIVKWPILGNVPSVWLYISAVSGYIGMVLLLWMYALGTRTVTGLFFADLGQTLRVHNWLGKYGVLLVFMHPFSIALSYGEHVVRYALVPNLFSSFEKTVTWGRMALYILLAVWLTSALLRDRIKYRPWRYVHYFSYLALPLALLHIPAIGSSYRSLSFPRFYYMATLGLFFLLLVLRLRQYFGLGRSSYTVTSQKNIGPAVFAVSLHPDKRRLTFGHGQYAYMQLRTMGEEHPFTVLRQNSKTGDLTIAYKAYGSFTKKLSQLQPGSKLKLDGPYGKVIRSIDKANAKATVYVAGGVGITPFVSSIIDEPAADTWLFYANQRPETALFERELHAKLGKRLVNIFSRDATGCDRSQNNESGYLNAALLMKYLGDPQGYDYYLCGSKGFVQSSRVAIEGLGVSADSIQQEQFTF